MSNQNKTILVVSVLLLLISTVSVSAQDADITNNSNTVEIENEWIHVTVTKVENFVGAGSILAVYDKRNDSAQNNTFVSGRWLDLSVDVVLGNNVYTVKPDTMKWVKKYSDRFVIRSSRFIDTDSGKAVPISTKMTVRLVRNRIYVDYLFSFNRVITLDSSMLLASFLDPDELDDVEAYNWSRFNHRNPVKRLSANDSYTFDDVIQPSHQVRFKGDMGSVDFHSPDVSMDHAVISRTGDAWVLFQQLLPFGTNCQGDHIDNVVKGGTSISRSVAILVNDSENTDKFHDAGLPTAALSPIPHGYNNVVVSIVDDLPTLTFDNSDYYNIPGENTATGAPIDQAYSFLSAIDGVNIDMSLIFDSMLTVTQSVANRRHYPSNTEIYSDSGAGYSQIWKFHNRTKNVANAGGAAYHKWLRDIEDDESSIGLVNRSYHMVRLEDVSLAEWEEDSSNRAQAVTPAYITNVLGALKADATKIGISVPQVYIPPQLIFDIDLLEPLVKIGTEGMIFCKRFKNPHPVYTRKGRLNALFYNWNPNQKGALKVLMNNIRKGWPIIGLGNYFNGTNARYSRIVNTYKRLLDVSPETIFSKSADYNKFVSERFALRFWKEDFDVTTGSYEITFEGSNSSGLTYIIHTDPQTRSLRSAPEVDGKEVEIYRVDEGKIFVVLPELTDKVHTLVVELY